MFKVKSNEEIGAYLKNIIDEKYESVRKFCKEFLLETDVEQSPENIRKMQNKISQILKGKKGVQTYDLPVFCKLLDKSCEAILSAGEVFVPEVNRMTNYLIAFSKDENEWKKFMSRENSLIFKTDEYGKNVIDYALEFKNYEIIKLFIDIGYITIEEDIGYVGDYTTFVTRTKIESRNDNNEKEFDPFLLKYLLPLNFRLHLMELAINNNDVDMLMKIRAREVPRTYLISWGKKLRKFECIKKLANAKKETLEYFTDDFEANLRNGQHVEEFKPETIIFPFVSELVDILIKNNNNFAKRALEKIREHNESVYNRLRDIIDESIKKNHEQFKYERTKEEIYKDEKFGIVLATEVFRYSEENGFIEVWGMHLGTYLFSNIIKLDTKTYDSELKKLIEEVNQYYKKVVNIREDYDADARRKYLNEHI